MNGCIGVSSPEVFIIYNAIRNVITSERLPCQEEYLQSYVISYYYAMKTILNKNNIDELGEIEWTGLSN